MTPSDNLTAYREKRESLNLTYDEKRSFDAYLIGALSSTLSSRNGVKQWNSCLETAARCIENMRQSDKAGAA